MTSGATQATEKPNKALKRRASKIAALEVEFAKRREAIESDETLSPHDKQSELRVAATELERAVWQINERS